MRLKGINPLEQHAEKAFLGLFLVAGLGVLAWQFVGKENTVKVGKEDVRLADAYAKVDEERKRTDARIRLANPDGLPPVDADVAVKQLADFEAKYRGPVAPAPALVAALDTGGLGLKGESPVARDLAALGEIEPPAPALPSVGAYMAAIDPIEAKDPEVAAVLPAAAPMDKAWVSVESVFDGAALKAALSADPDGDGPNRAMPKNWWDGSMVVLAVQMERQTLKPDGTYTDAEPVKTMPGRTVVAELDKLNTAMQIKDAGRWASENAAYVRRPDFYAIQVGDAWAPPSERERRLGEEGDKAQRVKTKYSQRTDKLRQRDALAKQLQGLGGGGGPGGGGGGRPGGGGGAGAPGRPTPPAAPGGGGAGGQDDPRKRSLQASVDRLNADIARLESELRELGEKVGDPAQGAAGSAAVPTKPGVTEASLLDNPAVRVWGHDVHVERGKTYRYRVRLALNNPYFGHGAAMLPAQAALASKGVWYTPMSEWSTPVRVDPETYLFFTSATPDDPGTRIASARAEVYQFRWGYWRKGQTTLEPGDAVNTEVRVPDFSKIVVETPAADPTAQPGGGRPGGLPSGPGRGAPGGGSPGGGRDPAPGSGTGDPTPGGQGGPGGQGRPVRPVGVPMVGVAVSDPTIMLGVTTAQAVDAEGKPRNVQQVYLREPAGQVVIRVPELERQESIYRRVSDSSERGERDQGKTQPLDRPGTGPTGTPGPTRPNQPPDGVPPSPGG